MLPRIPASLLLIAVAFAAPAADDAKLADQLARDLQPKLVTFKGKDVKLSKVLKAVQEQTGFEVAAENDETIGKLDLAKVPFWQAMETLARESDQRIMLYGRDRKVALVSNARGYRELPTSYSGPFRVTLKRMVQVHDLEDNSGLGVARLEVSWEPRFQAFLLEPHLDSVEIKDDAGLIHKGLEREKGKINADDRMALEFDLPIPHLPRSRARIASFSGTLTMIGSPKRLTFTLDKLAKGTKVEQEGVTIEIKNFREGKELWTIDVGMKYPPSAVEFESFQNWLISNEAYLLNKNGQRLDHVGYEADEGVTSMRYRFVENEEKRIKLGKPSDWKLVYRTPAQIVAVPIKFNFKDVPLP